jgi:N-acetylglucosamine malate deacetylase 1
MRVIVFSPHPDDDVIGCGGAIINHVEDGDIITIVYITSGDKGNPDIAADTLIAIREKEAQEAASILSVQDVRFLRIPDTKVRMTKENIRKIADVLFDIRPEKVYIPHEKEEHKDHKATYCLVIAALKQYREKNQNTVKKVLCYEVWTPIQEVTHYLNITKVIRRKLEALKKHTSQLRLVRYDKAIKGLNCYRGIMTIGEDTYCECFVESNEWKA